MNDPVDDLADRTGAGRRRPPRPRVPGRHGATVGAARAHRPLPAGAPAW